MSIALLVLLFALLFLVFVSLILFVVGPSLLLQPYRRTIDYYRRHTSLLYPSQLPYRHEEFTLASAEGIPLSCWLLHPAGEPRGTVVYLHGVSESKISGLPMANLLCGAGFLVMLYDARRHGDSGGRFCTYGFYEKRDTSTVISYLQSRPDLRLGRIGHPEALRDLARLVTRYRRTLAVKLMQRFGQRRGQTKQQNWYWEPQAR